MKPGDSFAVFLELDDPVSAGSPAAPLLGASGFEVTCAWETAFIDMFVFAAIRWISHLTTIIRTGSSCLPEMQCVCLLQVRIVLSIPILWASAR